MGVNHTKSEEIDKKIDTELERIQPASQQPAANNPMPLVQIQNRIELPPLKVPPGRKSTNKFKKTKDFADSISMSPLPEKKINTMQPQHHIVAAIRTQSPTSASQKSTFPYPSETDSVRGIDQIKHQGPVQNMQIGMRAQDRIASQKIKKFRPSKEEPSPPILFS